MLIHLAYLSEGEIVSFRFLKKHFSIRNLIILKEYYLEKRKTYLLLRNPAPRTLDLNEWKMKLPSETGCHLILFASVHHC